MFSKNIEKKLVTTKRMNTNAIDVRLSNNRVMKIYTHAEDTDEGTRNTLRACVNYVVHSRKRDRIIAGVVQVIDVCNAELLNVTVNDGVVIVDYVDRDTDSAAKKKLLVVDSCITVLS